jgi:hypothetical protein
MAIVFNVIGGRRQVCQDSHKPSVADRADSQANVLLDPTGFRSVAARYLKPLVTQREGAQLTRELDQVGVGEPRLGRTAEPPNRASTATIPVPSSSR